MDVYEIRTIYRDRVGTVEIVWVEAVEVDGVGEIKKSDNLVAMVVNGVRIVDVYGFGVVVVNGVRTVDVYGIEAVKVLEVGGVPSKKLHYEYYKSHLCKWSK